ncbi:hypothetical protein OIU84_009905 [Salix udensis]|uniref:Uncharacterized protein n=1 Tax=Salix udensis TaxID=889485 RepID=A0AAD6NUW6_9ROSI|nr:hypothetical protein OIU84_009905 [Salix udensis]
MRFQLRAITILRSHFLYLARKLAGRQPWLPQKCLLTLQHRHSKCSMSFKISSPLPVLLSLTPMDIHKSACTLCTLLYT